MSYALARNGLAQYQQVRNDASAEAASPHRLIQMLFEGALERIAAAKGALNRGEIARKGELIGKAISIVGGLREGLKRDADGDVGEIANNLDALYDYMQRRLFTANRENDAAMLDEVAALVREIKEAWDAIG